MHKIKNSLGSDNPIVGKRIPLAKRERGAFVVMMQNQHDL
jgi:hypothetical protein